MTQAKPSSDVIRSPGLMWPVTASQNIRVPAGILWNVISMPGNLELCHPFCESNPVTNWPGAESRDEVHYLNGLVFDRRFCKCIDGVGYDLKIGRKGGKKSFVSWRITGMNDSTSCLRIVVHPNGLQNAPAAIRWVPYLLKVRPMLKQYLSSVVRGFDWHLTRGTPVPRNQWGVHPWFSARG